MNIPSLKIYNNVYLNANWNNKQKQPNSVVYFSGRPVCSFLEPKQIKLITDSIINKFGDISSKDIKRTVSKISKNFPDFKLTDFIQNIASKAEFCNVKDFDKVYEYINKNGFQLITVEDIGLGNSLAYLQTKRNPNMQLKILSVPFADIPNKIASMRKKKPAIIISRFSLKYLEKLAKEKPEDFFKIVEKTNFIYPHNNINGVNAFWLSDVNELVKKGLSPECDDDLIKNFLALCKENIAKFSPDKPVDIKFHDIRNTMHYSVDALVNRLKYQHRFWEQHDNSFMPMARIMKQMQNDKGVDLFSLNGPKSLSLLRDAIFRHSDFYTPIKLNKGLKNLHSLISQKANGADVLYYLPKSDSPKSFNYILNSYFGINDLPKDKLIKDLSKAKPNQKIVILDDYIGSGSSMIKQLNHLKENNIKKENIIIASVIATKRGLQNLNKYTDNILTHQIISQFDIKKSGNYKKLATETERLQLAKIANEALLGGYDNGFDNFSTFYMTPNNNNNLFFANLAPNFTMSSYGIKTAFNTFDNTVKNADLSSIGKMELQEIIELYKKANAIIPDNIINKISELTPDDSSNLITVLNTYGKIKNPNISPKIANYLKKSLGDIDTQQINNKFLIDNIMDVCKYIEIEPPIKFVAQMINELQNPKSNVSDDILLHFYVKLIDKLSPMQDVNNRVFEIISNLKENQLIKQNILEDILEIAEHHNFELPKNIIKRLNEIMANPKGISLELLTSILKNNQLDAKNLNTDMMQKWWKQLPENIKEQADLCVSNYFDFINKGDIL